MSIINDALRKAEEENKKKAAHAALPAVEAAGPLEGPQTAAQIYTPAPQLTRPASRNKALNKKVTILAALMVINAVYFGYKPVKTTVIPYIQRFALPSIKANILSPAKSAVTGKPSFTLNGIVFDSARPYAIVNNMILTKGDIINGATLVDIQEDTVVFSSEGKEFRLTTKR